MSRLPVPLVLAAQPLAPRTFGFLRTTVRLAQDAAQVRLTRFRAIGSAFTDSVSLSVGRELYFQSCARTPEAFRTRAWCEAIEDPSSIDAVMLRSLTTHHFLLRSAKPHHCMPCKPMGSSTASRGVCCSDSPEELRTDCSPSLVRRRSTAS
ncbi:hypothetical protein MTO96_042037 [Rhipicephalus appendiculatus]